MARAIGLRVAVWGGVAALVLFVFGDIRPLVLPRWALSERPPVRPAALAASDKLRCRRLACPCSRDGCTTKAPGRPAGRSCVAPTTTAARPRPIWPSAGRPTARPCSGSGNSAAGTPDWPPSATAFTPKPRRLYGQSVVCLEADTGRTVWQQRYDWPYDAAGMYPGPRATPT